MQHVLLVEDDPALAMALAQCIATDELKVSTVPSARAALSHVSTTATDLVLLDADSLGPDGPDACTQLRSDGFRGGLILLAAGNTEMDRVLGLDGGADDFMGKPPSLAELRARVNAVLRRVHQTYDRLPDGLAGLRVDPHQPFATYRGDVVSLGEREYPLLATLLTYANQTVTHQELARRAWPDDTPVTTATMSMAVGRLRVKLRDAGVPHQIDSFRGLGYRLSSPPDL